MVIRGFRKSGTFEATSGARLNDQTRCELAALAASAWLNLRLQLIAQLVVTGVVVTALIGRALGWMDVSLKSECMRKHARRFSSISPLFVSNVFNTCPPQSAVLF